MPTHPPIADALYRHGIELIPSQAPLATDDQQPGVFENPHMLHHGRPSQGRLELLTDLAGGSMSDAKQIEDRASCRIGEGFPDQVLVNHVTI